MVSPALRRAVVVAAPRGRVLKRRARRAAFLARVRLAAAAADSTVDLEVASDVAIGRGVRVTFARSTHNVLWLGAGSSLGDRVLVQLKGGRAQLGPDVEVRRDTVLNVAGLLQIEGQTLISWGCVLHCAESIRIQPMGVLAEQVTLADSSHYFSEPDEHVWHNLRTAPITIGQNTWLCPKVTVTRGARVGAHCIVASNSVVVGEVPSGSLASGVPATARPLSLPWSR